MFRGRADSDHNWRGQAAKDHDGRGGEEPHVALPLLWSGHQRWTLMSSDKRLWIAGIRELQGCIKKCEQLETGVDSHSVSYLLLHIATKSVAFLRVWIWHGPCRQHQLEAGALISRKRSNYSDLTWPHPTWWFSKGNTLFQGTPPKVAFSLGSGNSPNNLREIQVGEILFHLARSNWNNHL